MFDVVKAASEYRNELLTEINRLEEFVKMAKKFTESAAKAQWAPEATNPHCGQAGRIYLN